MFKIISKTLILTGFLFMSALAFSASEDNTLSEYKPGDFSILGDMSSSNSASEDNTLCPEYRPGDFSILGDISPLKRFQNCLGQKIDESLGPLCEIEREVREHLAYYERRGYQGAIEIVEEKLRAIEDQKYEVATWIYAINEKATNITEELRTNFDRDRGSNDSFIRRIGASVGYIVVGSEMSGMTGILDSRVRVVCPNQIDLSRIPSRRSEI